MDENILVQLSDIVARHPWCAARAETVLAFLNELRISAPANILEVGCGWGKNLRILEGAGYRSRPVTSAMAAMFRIDDWRTFAVRMLSELPCLPLPASGRPRRIGLRFVEACA